MEMVEEESVGRMNEKGVTLDMTSQVMVTIFDNRSNIRMRCGLLLEDGESKVKTGTEFSRQSLLKVAVRFLVYIFFIY